MTDSVIKRAAMILLAIFVSALASLDSAYAAGDSIRQIFFRYNGVDDNYGKLAFVDYGRFDQIRFAEKLTCEMLCPVSMSASNSGSR